MHPFEICTLKLNTFPGSVSPCVEAVCKFLCRDLTNDPVDCCAHSLKICEVMTLQMALDAGKQEKVCWGQIQRVGWMGKESCCSAHHETSGLAGAVCRSIVMMQNEWVWPPPKIWSMPSDGCTQIPQCLDVSCCIHIAILKKFTVDNTPPVKEQSASVSQLSTLCGLSAGDWHLQATIPCLPSWIWDHRQNSKSHLQ